MKSEEKLWCGINLGNLTKTINNRCYDHKEKFNSFNLQLLNFTHWTWTRECRWLTVPFDGAFAEVDSPGVDDTDQWESFHLARRLLWQEADAAAVVGSDDCRVDAATALCKASQPPEGHTFGTEDLHVRAAGEQTLGETDAAPDV